MKVLMTIAVVVVAVSSAYSDNAVQLTFDPADDHNSSWSPDGSTIAFTSRRLGDKDIYTIPSTGGIPILVYSSTYRDTSPEWSPDGSTIVFYSSLYDELMKIPATGGTATRFTYDSIFNYAPSWSSDDTKIAFHGHYAKGGNQSDDNIYWVPADDGSAGPYLIITGYDNTRPEWAPDNSDKITLTRNPGVFPQIWVKTIGGTTYAVTDDLYDNYKSTWSPDGQYLAYGSTRSGNWDIWIIPASGGMPIQVTDDATDDFHPDWSPDGKKISFTSTRNGNDDIWVIDVSHINIESASLGEIKATYATDEMIEKQT